MSSEINANKYLKRIRKEFAEFLSHILVNIFTPFNSVLYTRDSKVDRCNNFVS